MADVLENLPAESAWGKVADMDDLVRWHHAMTLPKQPANRLGQRSNPVQEH